MNFLAGMLLLFLEPEDSFWGLIAVTEKYFSSNYFDQNLIGAQVSHAIARPGATAKRRRLEGD